MLRNDTTLFFAPKKSLQEVIQHALQYAAKGQFVALEASILSLKASDRQAVLNVVVFDCAKRGHHKMVAALLKYPLADKTNAILGYVHGGYEKAANALCGLLSIASKQLFLSMVYGYTANGHCDSLKSLLDNPPRVFGLLAKNISSDTAVINAIREGLMEYKARGDESIMLKKSRCG